MKHSSYYIVSLIIMVPFIYWSCSNCKKNTQTMDMRVPEVYYYFPYSSGQTIQFIHNHADTVSFVASKLTGTYDERSWTPKADGDPCTNYYHTQHFTQELSSPEETISFSRYVGETALSTTPCPPCQWTYTVYAIGEKFETNSPAYIQNGLVVNGIVYPDVAYITARNSNNDTLYITDKGIIRIVQPGEVYERVVK